jgi:hypothetical protein
MFANRYTALVDACALVSVPKRDLLLSLAEAEFFRLRWSRLILTETCEALSGIFQQRGFADSAARAARSVHAMSQAFPEALVEGPVDALARTFGLPDAQDEHVLAAAVHTHAQALVTENIRDFPAAVLAPLNIEARTADDFIADTIDLDAGKAVATVRRLRLRLKRPDMTAQQYLRSLEANGLFVTASILSSHAGSI